MKRRAFLAGIAGILVAAQAPAIIIPGRKPMVNGLIVPTRYVFDHAYMEWPVPSPPGTVGMICLYDGAWPNGKLLASWPEKGLNPAVRGRNVPRGTIA